MQAADLIRQFDNFVEQHRTTCLWYLRKDYLPQTDEERLAVLSAIQKHAGLASFRQAGEFKKWLLLRSKEPS